MNKIKGTILLLLTATLYMVAALKGSVGCMDNSQYLRQSFDTKAYHYVKCDCPCRSHAPGSNRCARCGHINVPQEEEYVTRVDAERPARSVSTKAPAKKLPKATLLRQGSEGRGDNTYDSLMQNPDVKLKKLLLKYRSK